MADDTGLHGVVQNNPILNALLNFGNKLRYGKSEQDRMAMVNALSAPGVKESAYDERGIYDPAGAERHTSSYLFGKRFAPVLQNEGARALAHMLSSGSREKMYQLGVPGVGEERPELARAEESGMVAGINEWLQEIEARKAMRGR
jgi:hypothetical protein